ncbi:hypothetical protein [Mycoplasma phocimorsus]|uniref:Uncharacterized protein n=1 Tax=Mycoplasma phocimorsus TaxID=3045839 RepID=A0AAJ1PSK9_9MOLU|nr:hypothetical protein [Mycoplasma phocimorsus]MDJ1645968.1 hypothetical protein [Mycoplasma phocimorsus]MDJ1646254.1 hypothetical protein [Mycoplasma phocimorsus]MDJ1646856.1 hypothetical protein [Mycoplasma phocimorsus]MDJ1647825.1 hypothetical protein [Mycoplasma phocimorsus]MDJ1648476.1 hypothetical protein [Mycoplasma phocimorsus]
MKKSIKLQTIIWGFYFLISVIAIIIASIWLHNGYIVQNVLKIADINTTYLTQSNAAISFAIGIIFFASIVIIIGAFVIIAGIKSWNYKRVEQE